MTTASTPSWGRAPWALLPRLGILKDLAHGLRPDVEAEDGGDGRIVEGAFPDHEVGPAVLARRRAFFGGLKEEGHGSLEAVLERVENEGRSQDDRAVDVVAAGVHDAGVQGLVGQARLFLDRQGIHVGPDRDRHAGLAAAEDGHDAGLGDARADLQAEALKPRGDEAGGLELAVAELGIHMDEAADLDDLGSVLLDLSVDPAAGLRIGGPGRRRRRGQGGKN
jgi:hypothetical protein